jgi:ATP-dependent Clp protease protease subunit
MRFIMDEPKEDSKFEDYLRFGALKARKFYLDAEIDGDLARRFRQETIAMLAESKEPIEIIINSPGGEVVAGFDIVSTIRQLQRAGIEVQALVQGDASSMAAVILASCKVRSMTSLSRLMWHGIQFMSGGDMNDAADQRAEVSRMIDKLSAILIGSAKADSKYASASFLKRIMKEKRPNWIQPEEALAAGLVQEVLD